MIRSSTAFIKKVMDPDFKSSDPRVNLKSWQKEAQNYFDKTGVTVPESIRRTVYLNKVAPPEMRQHLIMNQSRLITSADLEDEINEYCDAMEDFDQGRSGLVAAVAQEYYTDEWHCQMDPAYMVAPVGKSKSKGHQTSKGGKKGDGKDKGKLHKGLGKSPERAEYRRFGGMCNWCWRVGHKESACWFKQEYERTNGKPHTSAAAPSADSEAANKDIRTYFKRKSDANEDQAMDVGAVNAGAPPSPYPGSSPFVFAVNHIYEWEYNDMAEECSDEVVEDILHENVPIPDSEDDLEYEVIDDDEVVEDDNELDGYVFAVMSKTSGKVAALNR